MNSFSIKFLNLCTWLLLISGVQSLAITTVSAESELSLRVSAGINGEYKESDVVPLQVTITNQGADVEGELVMKLVNSGSSTATYYQPVSVAKGSTKVITMMVPGGNMLAGTNVSFMQAGKELAKADISGRWFGKETVFIGVYATDPNTANFLNTLPKQTFSEPVRLISLKDIDLSAAALPMLDVLVVNNFSTDNWQPEQVNQIKQWVSRGGTIILAGGPHFLKGATSFTDILPVSISGTANLDSLTGLTHNQPEKGITLSQPLTISKAAVKEGQVLYQQGDAPLIAMTSLDRGNVIYVAYDLAEEPLASWPGNGELWSQVLVKAKPKSTLVESVADNRYHFLGRAAESFSSLQPPDFTVLTLLFFGYALLVGPIIFFILRKKRRSYIWGVVPAISVLTCVAIYLYGIMHHGQEVKATTASHLMLGESGQAEVMSATSIFVPGGGDYRLRMKNVEMMLPRRWDSGNEREAAQTWVNMAEEQSLIEFKNVEHWSIRSAYSRPTVTDAGMIESNLVYEDGKLVGTVTNKTKYQLHDVKILSGSQVQDVGNLNPGDSSEVQVNYSNPVMQGSLNIPIDQLVPAEVQKQPDVWGSREYTMVQYLDYGRRSSTWEYPVKVIAWTDEPIAQIEVPGRKSEWTHVTLVTADAKINPNADGYVIYPPGSVPERKVSNSVPVREDSEGYYFEAGEITFDYHIAQETDNLAVSAIHLYTWSHNRTPLEKQVFNWQTQTFEKYEEVFTNNSLLEEKLAPYLSAEGTLRVKFAHSQEYDEHLGRPTISVEGWVRQ